MVDLLGHFLTKEGYLADKTSNCHEGLRLLEAQPYDLVLLDIKMPKISGREFYQTVHKRFPKMTERIVFVTGDVASRTTQKFIEETGNLCLNKPFTLKEIQDVLDLFFSSEDTRQ